MPTYRICGLNVAAEMGLPGAVPFSFPSGTEDVVVRQRPVPEHLDETDAVGPTWELNTRRFLLRLPAIGRFLAEDGRVLDMEPVEETAPADALPFLLGTGFGALLHQRGGMVLHAATVAWAGRAYALCGHSGIGKSTLAAALCQAGAQFIGDDMASVVLDGNGRPMVWPDGRQLKLYTDSIARCGLDAQRGDAVRSRIDKYYVAPRDGISDGPIPLAGVYLLRDERPPLTSGFERLTPLDAAQALLNESYRPRLLLAMAQARAGNHVALTAAVLRHTPVFHLTRPRDLDQLAATAERFMAHWPTLEG